MSNRETLHVWHENEPVGTLWRDAASRMAFSYDASWTGPKAFPLSQSMPLAVREYGAEDGTAHRFFANLVPEGAVRTGISRDLKIPDTDFELLRALGGECAGALSILPEGIEPSGGADYKALDEAELQKLLVRRGNVFTSLVEEDRPRLSLAGAQDKIPVFIRDGVLHVPLGDAPSSHILKFESSDFRHVILFEAFTMELAAAVGLKTPSVSLMGTSTNRYLVVERYDRIPRGEGGISRLHQEDFCQAMGLGSDRKYEEFGGPSMAMCVRLVRDVSTEPALDVPEIIRWQAFNVLAGNSDGHGKNLSLLYGPGGSVRLAPFYDLVCTRAIQRIDHRLALSVGRERDPGMVTRQRWEEEARACDLRPAFVLDMVQDLARALLGQLPHVLAAFDARYGPLPVLQRIERVVRGQITRALR